MCSRLRRKRKKMAEYNFITIHTLVDISHGHMPRLGEHYKSDNTNVSRLIEFILLHSPPFLTRIEETVVNFDKKKNCYYYDMHNLHMKGLFKVYTIKFAVRQIDVNYFESSINGMPVIVPTLVSMGILRRFITSGSNKNTTIQRDITPSINI